MEAVTSDVTCSACRNSRPSPPRGFSCDSRWRSTVPLTRWHRRMRLAWSGSLRRWRHRSHHQRAGPRTRRLAGHLLRRARDTGGAVAASGFHHRPRTAAMICDRRALSTDKLPRATAARARRRTGYVEGTRSVTRGWALYPACRAGRGRRWLGASGPLRRRLRPASARLRNQDTIVDHALRLAGRIESLLDVVPGPTRSRR